MPKPFREAWFGFARDRVKKADYGDEALPN
jgi:hypothetical protein